MQKTLLYFDGTSLGNFLNNMALGYFSLKNISSFITLSEGIIIFILICVIITTFTFIVLAERSTTITVKSLLDSQADFDKRNKDKKRSLPIDLVYSERTRLKADGKGHIVPVPFLTDRNDPTGIRMKALLPYKELTQMGGLTGFALSYNTVVNGAGLQLKVLNEQFITFNTPPYTVLSNGLPIQKVQGLGATNGRYTTILVLRQLQG